MESLMNYREAAEYLCVPVGTLYALVHQGRVPHVRLGRRFVRFDKKMLAAWVSQHHVEAGGVLARADSGVSDA